VLRVKPNSNLESRTVLPILYRDLVVDGDVWFVSDILRVPESMVEWREC
jgi:hypothetical protein